MDEEKTSNVPSTPGYEFLQVIAEGGTSQVWLAKQKSLDRVVAVKVLDASLLEDAEERERFRAEAKAAGQLDLPALVRVLDFGESDGLLYYVMEYVEGMSLADWLRDHGRMSVVQALQVAEIIASAMGAAWEKAGLVHGDIKPGNVLLGQDGAVKLTDLGLARLTARSRVEGSAEAAASEGVTSGDEKSGGWTLAGTPTYLAPEQVQGVPASVQSDIYSLGLTLYHLVTGKVPFDGLGLEKLLEAQLNDYLPDPCEVTGAKVPVGVAWLLAKMTAKEPSERPASWASLLEDLEKVIGGGRPSGPFPDETGATILLSPAHRPGARGNTINLSAAGRKAILVTTTPRNMAAGGTAASRAADRRAVREHMRGASGGGCFMKLVGFLAFLALVAGGVWLGVFRGHPERWESLKASFAGVGKPQRGAAGQPGRPMGKAQTDGSGASEVAPAASENGAPKPKSDASEMITIPAAGAAKDRGTDVQGAWADERYVAAAEAFNATLAKYQDALKREAKPDDAVWREIEREAKEAAVALDALRLVAPPGVPLRDYANMAYQLVKDARTGAMTKEEKREAWVHAPKRRHPGAAPWPSPAKDDSNEFSMGLLQLGYAWDVLPAPSSTVAVEWLALISTEAVPMPNTAGDETLPLFGPLRFMMDATEAARRLGQPLPVRRAVTNELFPYGGVFAYDLDAKAFGNIRRPARPYPKLTLLADADDQLMGLYYVDDEPTALVHSEVSFSDLSEVADFGTGAQLDPDGPVKPCHQFLLGSGIIRVDSETADFSEDPPRPLRQSTLILPKTVMDCLLYHVLGGTN